MKSASSIDSQMENVIHPGVDRRVDLEMDQVAKKTAIEVALYPKHRWLLVEGSCGCNYNNFNSRVFAMAWVLLVTLSLP
jgi:hypothetical protein